MPRKSVYFPDEQWPRIERAAELEDRSVSKWIQRAADHALAVHASPPSLEAEWRRQVMSDAKDALACGDSAAAYEALTRHERDGYPWAPGHTLLPRARAAAS